MKNTEERDLSKKDLVKRIMNIEEMDLSNKNLWSRTMKNTEAMDLSKEGFGVENDEGYGGGGLIK